MTYLPDNVPKTGNPQSGERACEKGDTTSPCDEQPERDVFGIVAIDRRTCTSLTRGHTERNVQSEHLAQVKSSRRRLRREGGLYIR